MEISKTITMTAEQLHHLVKWVAEADPILVFNAHSDPNRRAVEAWPLDAGELGGLGMPGLLVAVDDDGEEDYFIADADIEDDEELGEFLGVSPKDVDALMFALDRADLYGADIIPAAKEGDAGPFLILDTADSGSGFEFSDEFADYGAARAACPTDDERYGPKVVSLAAVENYHAQALARLD